MSVNAFSSLGPTLIDQVVGGNWELLQGSNRSEIKIAKPLNQSTQSLALHIKFFNI